VLATDHIIDRLLVDITEDVVIRSFNPFGQLHENVIFSDNTVLCPKALLNGINQSGLNFLPDNK